MKKFLLACVLLLPFAVSAPATMVIRDFQALRHDRFYAGLDKAFVGDPYDFSGVGQGASGQWATLVSDCFFISANHSHPGIGENVTFWESNSLADPSHTYNVLGGQQIGATDLWVGFFAASVDASLARYAILDLPNASDYLGLTAFNYGVNHLVGRNILEDVQFIGPAFPNEVGFIYDYDDTDTPSVGGDETFLQGGDSGGPSFSIADGQLALTGIHAGIAFPYFVDGAVPAYITEINDVLDDKGQALTLIPEPATGALLLAGSLLAAGRRARKKLAA